MATAPPGSGSMDGVPTVARWWSSRSDAQRIGLYTRWSYYGWLATTPLLGAGVLRSAPVRGPVTAAVLFGLGTVGVAVVGVLLVRAGPAGDRAAPAWPAGLPRLAVLVAGATAVAGWSAVPPGDGDSAQVPWGVALPAVMVLTALSAGWTARLLVRGGVLVGALVAVAGAAGGAPAGSALGDGAVLGLTAAAIALVFRFSVWVLGVVRQMELSRGVELRLAVAEERLRFARDLHDVMGRDLSTIAVKSQLAGELVRRGRPGAAEEVADISRIAETSLREVRDVVRGYRTADLSGELAGARSVLRAAGVACTVIGEETGAALPGEVQVALGWVVREAVTNVLRHSRASACTITLDVPGGEARLDVDNDGAGSGPVTWGNGLTGLAERLADAGGRLAVGGTDGRFCLSATVPAAVPG